MADSSCNGQCEREKSKLGVDLASRRTIRKRYVDMSNRNICIFCETWESGGIESFLNSVLKHIALDNLSVDIVAAELRNSVFTQDLQDRGVNFIELSGSLYRLRENYRQFSKLLNERHYDVMHLNAYQGMSLYYIELARCAGVSVRIAHSHNTALRRSMLRSAKTILHDVYRHRYTASATELCACSEQAATFLFPMSELRKRGYRFIPNGIDTERFRFRQDIRNQVRHELGLDGKFVIGNVGRLCYQKNQMFLVDAMNELLKTQPESVLLLIGEGEDRISLEKKVKQMHIDSNVLFYGTSNHVEQLFCAMDLFAFPSRFEGFGIAIIEAQCEGLPVVCSTSVPMEARILPQTVCLPLNGGSEVWAKKMLEFCNAKRYDGVTTLGEKGYSIEKSALKIKELYCEESAGMEETKSDN